MNVNLPSSSDDDRVSSHFDFSGQDVTFKSENVLEVEYDWKEETIEISKKANGLYSYFLSPTPFLFFQLIVEPYEYFQIK